MIITECIAENINPISEPYYTDYEELRRLCLSILWDEGASCFGGSDFAAIKGVLIYIPGLWERYLEKQFYASTKLKSMLQVQPVLEVNNCKKQWEHLEYTLQGCFSLERTKLYATSVQNIRNTIRPDFVLSDESGNVFLILDAKHKDVKYLDDESEYKKLMRDQICYHFRQYLNPESNKRIIETLIREDYLNKVFIPLGGLVFPISDKCTNYSEGVCLQNAFPVRIPQPKGTVDYLTWKKVLDGYIRDTVKNIEDYMEIACSEPVFDKKGFEQFTAYLSSIVPDHILKLYRK